NVSFNVLHRNQNMAIKGALMEQLPQVRQFQREYGRMNHGRANRVRRFSTANLKMWSLADDSEQEDISALVDQGSDGCAPRKELANKKLWCLAAGKLKLGNFGYALGSLK
ncbi:MAG TPA: hypothetical protein VFV50_05795, partial [Bdellovibrionales bacterium]|nr:hypothetical protein [Bdellovibrionales bacterium]